MIVEQSVECELTGETEVLGENLNQCHFATTYPKRPDRSSNPGPRGGKSAANRHTKKYLQATTHIDVGLVPKVSGTVYIPTVKPDVETHTLSGASGTKSTLTRMIAPEDFTVCCIRESNKLKKITHTVIIILCRCTAQNKYMLQLGLVLLFIVMRTELHTHTPTERNKAALTVRREGICALGLNAAVIKPGLISSNKTCT
jgi:hypothetical protein